MADPADVEALLAGVPLTASTPRTLTTLEALHEDLARIRRRGYATDNEEHELGVACVATPVFDHVGRPVAAISVSGPTHADSQRGTADLAGLLRGHAEQVSPRVSAIPQRTG